MKDKFDIDIIEELQVVGSFDGTSINEHVKANVETTLDEYEDIIENGGKTNLEISPMDYFQCPSGVLVKKESGSIYVDKYRNDIYKYLYSKFGKTWVNSLLMILNSSVSMNDIEKFTSGIEESYVLENVYLLSIIELDFLGKSYLVNKLLNIISKNGIYLETFKVLGYHLFSIGKDEGSYKMISKLEGFEELEKDKELLATYIILLRAFSTDKKVMEYVGKYETLSDSNHEEGKIDDETYTKELLFVNQNHLDNLLKNNDNPSDLIIYGSKAVELGNKSGYFYAIQGCLLKKDYKTATDLFKIWVGEECNLQEGYVDYYIFGEENYDQLENFYILGEESGVIGSVGLLLDFYRERFAIEGYNDGYFETMIFYASGSEYSFTEKDRIFFDLFAKEVERLDNDKQIIELVEFLFFKYTDMPFALYLDKILLVISKFLRGKYENNFEVKKALTIGFENMAQMDEYNQYNENDIDIGEYEAKLKRKVLLLNDNDYLDARFDEMLLKFLNHNLNFISSFDKSLNIPMYMASIFEHYGLYDDMNRALKNYELFDLKKEKKYH